MWLTDARWATLYENLGLRKRPEFFNIPFGEKPIGPIGRLFMSSMAKAQ